MKKKKENNCPEGYLRGSGGGGVGRFAPTFLLIDILTVVYTIVT